MYKLIKITAATFDGMSEKEIDGLTNYKSNGYKLDAINDMSAYALQFINQQDLPALIIEVKFGKYTVWFYDNGKQKSKVFKDEEYPKMWNFVKQTLPRLKNVKA